MAGFFAQADGDKAAIASRVMYFMFYFFVEILVGIAHSPTFMPPAVSCGEASAATVARAA